MKQKLVATRKQGIPHITKVIPYSPATLLPGIYPKELKTQCPHKNLYMDVYSCFAENLEAKVSFGRYMDRLWYIQTREYY